MWQLLEHEGVRCARSPTSSQWVRFENCVDQKTSLFCFNLLTVKRKLINGVKLKTFLHFNLFALFHIVKPDGIIG